MKILFLSNFPHDFLSYDRDLRSKIHKEIKKHMEVLHYIYLYKGKKDNSSFDSSYNIIEMPFHWDHFYQKIAGILFIFFNNIKIISKSNVDLIRLEMGSNGVYDFLMFFYPLLFQHKKFYIETTTPSVHKNKFKRTLTNFFLMLVLKPYKNIGVASISTQKIFKVSNKKAHYVDLGFPEYSFNNKNFNELSLVYLGTLNNRDIWKTVIGVKIFTQKYPDIKITYDIIGGGNENYVNSLKKSLNDNNMSKLISYHGIQPVDFVNEIFKRCNVGVAFVPIVDYYDNVSTTKAVEYLLAGMPIIATKTTFSTKILNPEAGVLCNDTSEDFAKAIEEIYNNRNSFNSVKIRNMYEKHSMNYSIKNAYIPILKSLM